MVSATRSLTLVRHGAAMNEAPGRRSDFDRTLSPRGIEEAKWAGEVLAARSESLGRVLSSTAIRARQTTRELMDALHLPSDRVEWVERLYGADPQDLIDCVDALPPTIFHVALVGHNPGLSQLGAHLSREANFFMPTCGLARFELALDSWPMLGPQCVQCFELERPE